MQNQQYLDRTTPIRAEAVGIKIALLFALASLGGLHCSWAGDVTPLKSAIFDEEMSGYKATEASGVVAALQQRIARGEAKLDFEPSHGYLLSLLRELKLPASSQLLVASKTSPNRDLISPSNPRALYFNEAASVAYVPAAQLIEVAAWDPKLGVVFYTLDQKAVNQPKLVRDNRCLECHASSKTLNVPGLLVRSFLTKDDGDVDVLSGIMVNHRTPIAERWGGYYVTGTHGTQTHRGNLFGPHATSRTEQSVAKNGNITDLKPFLNPGKFPNAGSDIVALLVHDHQVHMQNLLTRLAYEANSTAGDTAPSTLYPTVEAVLRYMLFVDEARLVAPVRGTSEFTSWFEQEGPKDKQGRSLRQFDLQTRLFKFPCSFTIYSPAFNALPYSARKRFYHRLWEILSGADQSPDYKGLAAETRKTILEILVATKSNLPVSWRF